MTVTTDVNNPSSATVVRITNGNVKRVDHYYYDCLKKKWVWVAREWYRASTPTEFGEWTPVSPEEGVTLVPGLHNPLPASPDGKQVPASGPPGADVSAGDPNRAYNPRTGENFVWVGDGWVETRTGKKMPAPRLCPACPQPTTTETPPKPATPPPSRKTPPKEHAQNTVCPEERKSVGLLPPQQLTPFDKRILDLHNSERAAVGAPPVEWNAQLASDANGWAIQLAQSGQLIHAPREGRGIERENLSEGNPWWTTDQMVDSWRAEKRYFHAGLFPNVCTGDWSQCAHYSQMIWPTTTELGCGEASGSGHKWLVCRYSPGGNKDGKPVGEPVQIAERPCADDDVVPKERG